MKQVKISLDEKGIKPTYQRMAILRYLRSTNRHPTADQIYAHVATLIPTISRTTVYNSLNRFATVGLIDTVMITGSETRFELHGNSHHHFYCQKCHQIYDIDLECPYHFEPGSRLEGHLIKEIHGYFKGICQECQQSKQRGNQ